MAQSLHDAIELCDFEKAAKMLLESGEKAKLANAVQGMDHWTPLIRAAWFGAPESFLRLLMGQGADLYSRSWQNGSTALHHAAYQGHVTATRVLGGAMGPSGINAPDCRGGSALHDAAFTGQAEAVAALLELGADPTLLNYVCRTPRDYAKDNQLHRVLLEAEQRWNESHPVTTSALLQLGSPAFKPESMLKVYRPRDVLPLDRRGMMPRPHLTPFGRGSFGEVYHVRIQSAGITCVMKSGVGGAMLKEAFYLSTLQSPYIVQYHGVMTELDEDSEDEPAMSPPTYWLLMERMDCDLQHYLSEPTRRTGERRLSNALFLMHQVAAGLDFLHTRDPAVVHRDLHMGNVLMKNGRPKISDLGQSRVVVGRELTSRRTRVKLTALPGRPDVMAPEALTGDYGTPLDIFSFGLMLCQVVLCVGKDGDGWLEVLDEWGFHDLAWRDEVIRVCGERREGAEAAEAFAALAPLVTACLAESAADRPTAPDLLARLAPDGAV